MIIDASRTVSNDGRVIEEDAPVRGRPIRWRPAANPVRRTAYCPATERRHPHRAADPPTVSRRRQHGVRARFMRRRPSPPPAATGTDEAARLHRHRPSPPIAMRSRRSRIAADDDLGTRYARRDTLRRTHPQSESHANWLPAPCNHLPPATDTPQPPTTPPKKITSNNQLHRHQHATTNNIKNVTTPPRRQHSPTRPPDRRSIHAIPSDTHRRDDSWYDDDLQRPNPLRVDP